MVRIENEKEILSSPERYPAIVPFLMEEYRGKTDFEIYRGIKKQAEAFLSTYEGRYFSKTALKALLASLDPYLEKHGFFRYHRGETVWYRHFELRAGAAVDPSLLRGDSFFLDADFLKSHADLGNATTFSLTELAEKALPAFVSICEGKVVSVAAVNENLSSDAMPEMTVETAVAYRGRRLASANAAALADYLLRRGRSVAYCCRYNHTASRAIARAVGFEEVGRFFAVSAYRR